MVTDFQVTRVNKESEAVEETRIIMWWVQIVHLAKSSYLDILTSKIMSSVVDIIGQAVSAIKELK